MSTTARRPLYVVIGIWAALGAAGCGDVSFRAETQLFPDGSVERAIYQPAGSVPAEVRSSSAWQQVTYAKSWPAENPERSIRELPILPMAEDRGFFAAWGRFGTAGEIPGHLVFPAEIPGRDGRLLRELQVRDYGFVVEYDWRESLNDVVTLEDALAACQEAADLAVELLPQIVEKCIGSGCNASKLQAWLDRQGRRWFLELFGLYYEQMARRDTPAPKWPAERVAAVCRRYGLHLAIPPQEQGDAMEAECRRFVRDLLNDTLTGPNSQPCDAARVEQLASFIVKGALLGTDQPAEAESGLLREAFERAAAEVLVAKFGLADDGSSPDLRPLTALMQRIWGLYHNPILSFPRGFHYQMTMPGRIGATNGQLLDDHHVTWSFTDHDAYPLGFHMECRALRVDHALQQAVLRGKPLDRWANVLALAAAARRYDGLAAALRACRDRQSLRPFEQYRGSISGAAERRAASAVAKALGILH